MRADSSVTAISWVPRGALDALPQITTAPYDDPPPETLDDLDPLYRDGAFRLVNELRAWLEIEDGRIVRFGRDGDGLLDEPALDVTSNQVAFAGVELPVIRPDPHVGDGWVRFSQTVGGRIGLPLPRPIAGKPYPHLEPAAAWTTLELEIRADGTSRGSLVGASPFPSHWVYDERGRVVAKRAALDLGAWYSETVAENAPWSADELTAAVSSLERELGRRLLADGASVERRNLATGEVLVEQGERGDVLFLLLIGALDVEIDGVTVARVGPGAIVGEAAVLRGGRRTATLRAAMPSRVAVAPGDGVDRVALRRLGLTRRRAPR